MRAYEALGALVLLGLVASAVCTKVEHDKTKAVVRSVCVSPDPEDCKHWQAPTVCNPLPWTTMAGTAAGPTWVAFDGAHWYCLNDPNDGRLTCWRNGQ